MQMFGEVHCEVAVHAPQTPLMQACPVVHCDVLVQAWQAPETHA
jgi:hypothetical protein